MANKISVILDVATDKAVGGLKGFKASVNDADGAVGKFKAGASSAFESIKAHAGQLALAGGAALVAFGVKAVGAFKEVALEAGRLGDVTGLAVDEASRWIAVGDDIGVSASTLETAFGKMNVEIGKGGKALEEFGIGVVKAKDGTVDANATFLNAIETIKGIQDPTKKAQAAQAAFGRGWKEMAELIDMGSADIVTAMGEVSDAQIVDEGEVAKARKLRESLDTLSDSVKDVAINVGEELTPAISTFAEMLAGVAPIAGKMASFVGDAFVKIADEAYKTGKLLAEWADALPFVEVAGLAEGIEHTTYEFGKLEQKVADNIDKWQEGVPTMAAFEAKLHDMGLSQDEVNIAMGLSKFSLSENKKATEEATGATEDYTGATDEQVGSTEKSTLAHWDAAESIAARERADEAATEAAEAATEAINEQIEALIGLVGGDIAVRDAQREAAAAVAELTVAMDAGELSAEELAAQQDAVATELIDAAKAAAEYDEKIGNAAGTTLDAAGKEDLLRSKLEELAATLAPGSALRQQIQGYIDDLARVPAEVRTVFTQTGATGPHQGPIRGTLAAGGPVQAGSAYVVGEQGAEVFVPSSNGTIVPNGNGHGGVPGGGSSVNVVVNMPPGSNGDDVVRAIEKWRRRNGNAKWMAS